MASTFLRDDPTVPNSTHHALSQRNTTEFHGILRHAQLPSAATGSYSQLAADGRTVVLRANRQGSAEHGHRITAALACHVARAGGTVDQLTRLTKGVAFYTSSGELASCFMESYLSGRKKKSYIA